MIVMVTLVPAARVPAVQVTVPPLVFAEPLGVRVHEPRAAARPEAVFSV
jgi:hypothetical protein